MSNKVSEIQKKEILDAFVNGTKIIELSKNFNFTVPTITRQLKNILGKEKFLEIKNCKKVFVEEIAKIESKKLENSQFNQDNYNNLPFSKNSSLKKSEMEEQSFFEVPPLFQEVDFNIQKDITSIPISEVKFPNLVFMIVDKNIELVSNYLKELPEWSFLPEDDLNRKIIKIYSDLKNAKRECRKDQKVIKVPNTNVFKVAAPFLVARGISRIISESQLISI